jgi:beta-N-acetylhexosaminidase
VRHRFSAHPRWLITLAIVLVVLLVFVVTLRLSGAGKQAARPTFTPTPTVIVSLLPSATPWLTPPPTAEPVPTPTSTATPEPTPAATLPPTQTPTPAPSASPVPIPTATPAPTPTCVNLANWPVLQRLNQLIMVSADFSNLSASVADARAGVGAFVLFGQPSAGSGPAISSGLAALYNNARASGQVLPWIATDEEGGSVARLADVIGPLPSARQMVGQWTPAHVQAVMAAHAAAMWNLGVIMDLAPVLDTASPNNTIAEENQRSFSENGQTAAAYGIAFANGLRASGVVPVVKHFPGLGHASANTDLGPATVPSLAELEANDLIPFEQAIARGVPAIMVSHASVPGLTGTVPASLSPATYQFLRNHLHFTGVTMTDSLGAGAISAAGYSQASAAVAAIEAGANMVMINRIALQPTLSALQQAIGSGVLSLNQVDASVAQILVSKGHAACQ